MAAAPESVVVEDADVPLVEDGAVEDGAVEQVLCEECGEGPAILFCRQCSQHGSLVCEECVKQHRKMKNYGSHEIISLAGIAKERARLPPPPPRTCGTHDDSPVTKFCLTCSVLFCPKCKNHDAHAQETRGIAEYAPEVRGELEDQVKRLEERVRNLEKTEQEVQATADEVEQQKETLPRAISEAFKTAHALLVEREDALKREVPKLAEKKSKVLGEQKQKLFEASTALRKVIELTKQQVGGATNEGLVEMAERKQKDLEKALKDHEDIGMIPDAVADIDFSPPSAAILGELGEVGALFCKNEPVLLRQTPEKAMVFEPVQVQFRMETSVNQPAVHAVLTSLADPGIVVKVKAGLHFPEEHIYMVELVPQIRGRHTLVITVAEQTIGKKPFHVFVTRKPTDLKEQVHKFSGFKCPYGITITPQGQLVVADRDSNQLAVVDRRNGNKLKTMSVSCPYGVAVTADGTIYASHPDSVEKFSVDGNHVKSIGQKGSNPLQFNDPYHIKAIGNELYVCDRGNSRVQVLDSDGNYLRQFPTAQCSSPYDITATEDGLCVVGSGDICMYNMEGGLVEKLQVKGCPEAPSDLRGVVLDPSGYMFITEYGGGKECVYVFKPSGEYVTRFGLRSDNMIQDPIGIAIDEDGFVYVCDHSSAGHVWVF